VGGALGADGVAQGGGNVLLALFFSLSLNNFILLQIIFFGMPNKAVSHSCGSRNPGFWWIPVGIYPTLDAGRE
jgi:hypothetical protein